MGLIPIYLDFIAECLQETSSDLHGKKMLELGNQEIMLAKGIIPERTGKVYFQKRGVEHTSIDLNGLDGALPLDLGQPIHKPEWHGYFDIITNSGTSEHVEPHESQYTCFQNIHNFLKPGGIVFHILPDIDELEQRGRWKGHCNNYYSHDFFKMLAAANGYTLVALKILDGNIAACLQKQTDTPFMDNREKFLKQIPRKSGGVLYLGINEQGFSPWAKLFKKIRAQRRLLKGKR